MANRANEFQIVCDKPRRHQYSLATSQFKSKSLEIEFIVQMQRLRIPSFQPVAALAPQSSQVISMSPMS